MYDNERRRLRCAGVAASGIILQAVLGADLRYVEIKTQLRVSRRQTSRGLRVNNLTDEPISDLIVCALL